MKRTETPLKQDAFNRPSLFNAVKSSIHPCLEICSAVVGKKSHVGMRWHLKAPLPNGPMANYERQKDTEPTFKLAGFVLRLAEVDEYLGDDCQLSEFLGRQFCCDHSIINFFRICPIQT